MVMAATEKGDENEHVNVAENVVQTGAGVAYMQPLAFPDTMSVLIGIVGCSTNQPFMRLCE